MSWSNILFVLCSVLTPALCCDWLRNFGHLNGESLKLIQNMGGPLTDQESPVHFPYRLYDRIKEQKMESQLVFVRDSLMMISDLYPHEKPTSVTWDNNKMEHFLGSIHRQTVELNRCVPPSKQVNRKLRNYFRRLTRRTLNQTDGSAASWELIRKETYHHLCKLDILVNSFTRSTTPAQHVH